MARMADDYDLDRAYQIHGPEEARALYRRWAASYDQEFGSGWGYIAPREIARLWVSERREGDEPLLDIGAGTGPVAEHLGGVTVDAIDITPEMLDPRDAGPPKCWPGPRPRGSIASATSGISPSRSPLPTRAMAG